MTALRPRLGLLVFVLAGAAGTVAAFLAAPTRVLLDPFVVIACLLVVVGEQLSVSISRRVIAPLTTAAALGLVLSPVAHEGRGLTAATVIALVWSSMLVGGLVAKVGGGSVVEGPMASRFLGLATTAAVARALPVGEDGERVVELAFAPDRHPVSAVLLLLAAALAGGLVERVFETITTWGREHLPWRALVADELGSVAGLGLATVSSGPLIAIAYLSLGWAALPCFLLPMVLVLWTGRRVAVVRRAQRQSVEAMSRLGEVAGMSVPGRTHRVAEMSVRVARALALDEATVRRVHRTALLHDVGLLGLAETPAGGVGAVTAGPEREQVAAAERQVVVRSGVFDDVAHLIAEVRTPFRRSREYGEVIPVESRIVRVASAWDEITEGSLSGHARVIALERLHLGLGYEYDPEVVDALEVSLPT